MKKISVSGMVFLIALMGFTACNSAKDVNDSNSPQNPASAMGSSADSQTGVNAQYIRTNGYTGGMQYPIITVVSSASELNQYYEQNKAKYDLSSRSSTASDSTIGFADAIKKYSNEYFANNFLVLVVLEEGSGSIRHTVAHVDESGTITINRLLPEIGTTDMAEWHIIIELNNVKLGQFKVTLVDK